MANDPSTEIPAVTEMREDWVIVDALMGGTKAMRKAGTKFLPKWPKEEQDAYDSRLKASTLLPAYSETVQNMTGRVFAEPIGLGDNVPDPLKDYSTNIDRQGNNLQVWSQSLFSTALANGLCHVLVDYPQTAAPDGSTSIVSRADEIAAGVRPYAIIIRPEQVLGWKSESTGGEHVLSQFRFMESVEEADPDNEFVTKQVAQVRVLEPGKWATYRKGKGEGGKEEWQLYEEGTTTLDKIPLATLYTKRTGYLSATPPLMELAHLNIKHWQSQSDQDNILHIARVPMLAVIGIEDETWEMKVGTSTATKLPLEGDMKWVEHTGKAIDSGRQSLQDLIDDMRIAGAKLLHKEKQATKTAAQAEEEAAQEMSPLETMAGQLEDCLDQVLQLFAEWMKLPEGGNCQVNGNFDVDYAPETTLPLLLNMAGAGRLSNETLFAEYQRRGVLSDDLDWETEKEKIEAQGVSLGMAGVDGDR
ncbi:MAG: DUF4055 domain-containing protein [Gammaproteobacteria bacterium]